MSQTANFSPVHLSLHWDALAWHMGIITKALRTWGRGALHGHPGLLLVTQRVMKRAKTPPLLVLTRKLPISEKKTKPKPKPLQLPHNALRAGRTAHAAAAGGSDRVSWSRASEDRKRGLTSPRPAAPRPLRLRFRAYEAGRRGPPRRCRGGAAALPERRGSARGTGALHGAPAGAAGTGRGGPHGAAEGRPRRREGRRVGVRAGGGPLSSQAAAQRRATASELHIPPPPGSLHSLLYLRALSILSDVSHAAPNRRGSLVRTMEGSRPIGAAAGLAAANGDGAVLRVMLPALRV